MKNNNPCQYYDIDLSGHHYTVFEHIAKEENKEVVDEQESDTETESITESITLKQIIEDKLSSGKYSTFSSIKCYLSHILNIHPNA